MTYDVIGKGSQRTANEPNDAVGVSTGSAALDSRAPFLKACERTPTISAPAQQFEVGREGGKPEGTRPTLTSKIGRAHV